jgi:hypothetical protein
VRAEGANAAQRLLAAMGPGTDESALDDVLRDALAQVRDGAEHETPSGADDDMGGGAEALVDRAIAAKQTQVQRLAELHEGEISLLQQLQETVQELSSTLRVARGEAKGARREVAELRAQLHDQINRVSTAERAVEEARDALRSAELEHEEELETKLRALQTAHVRALHELDQRADAAEAEVATLQVSLTRAQAHLLQIDKLREENNRLQVECDGWAAKVRRAAEESALQASIAAARQLELADVTDERDHDLGVDLDALAADADRGLGDGAHLHLVNLGVGNAQSAAAVAEHGVGLMQCFGPLAQLGGINTRRFGQHGNVGLGVG